MRPDGLLSVGELARQAGLTSKAVRHYDRIGLLRPDTVDTAGYRWYSPDQVDLASRIAVLREVDVPLDDVRRCLADPATIPEMLGTQRRRLDARLARVQRQLHTLDHLRTDGLGHDMPNTDTGLNEADERARRGRAVQRAPGRCMEKENRTRAEDDDDAAHGACVTPSLGTHRHPGEPRAR